MEKARDQNAEKQQSPFTRIGDIHIPTTNIDTSIAWYTNILGFKLKYVHNPGTNKRMAVLEVPGGSILLLIESSEYRPFYVETRHERMAAFSLYCSDIEDTHRFLSERGIKVGSVGGDTMFRSFNFEDPEGNLITAAWWHQDN